MFDALTKFYEGNNINQKMSIKSYLKNLNMQKLETIKSYFTRVSQINEQLEFIRDTIEEAKIMMTTLHGIPRSWETFI